MEESSAFKNMISPQVVKTIGSEISKVYPQFETKAFNEISSGLKPLELKDRVLLIATALKKHLPTDYSKALKILVKVMEADRLEGFSLWPFSEYIGQHGLQHFDESMKAMYVLTQKFTSEFAVRSYFIQDSNRTLGYFKKWSTDQNHHVRRWVSEGSRPLLPWGKRLPEFVENPERTLDLLQRLKFDEELYVRKSVANHLNDISKHHPQLVVKVLSQWKKDCPEKHRDKFNWIQRQALRTLIKKGDPAALKLMGASGEAAIKMSPIQLNQSRFKSGDKMEFSFEITSQSRKTQKLVIDYLIHFRKANGTLKSKVYKLKTVDLKPQEKISIQKSHSLRPITTMVYYSGEHEVSIQVNGKIYSSKKWRLDI